MNKEHKNIIEYPQTTELLHLFSLLELVGTHCTDGEWQDLEQLLS